jgi:hypothetical protein
MYIGAAAIAAGALVFFFLGQLDAPSLTMALGAALSVAGLSAKLNRFLPDVLAVAQDLKDKNLKGALVVVVDDSAAVSDAAAGAAGATEHTGAPPSAPASRLILIFILSVCAFGIAAGPASAQRKPDFTEFRGTQGSPMCAVRISGRWEFYRCGAATEAQQFREARSTVWVDGYTPAHRTIDKSFIVANLIMVAATAGDIAVTQRGIRRGLIREGNPLMGQSLGQQCAVGFGMDALAVWASHKRKAALQLNSELGIVKSVNFWNRLGWETPQIAQTLAHLGGIYSAGRAH